MTVRAEILAEIERRYGNGEDAGVETGLWAPFHNSTYVILLSSLAESIAEDAAERGYIPEALVENVVLGILAAGLRIRDSRGGVEASAQWLVDAVSRLDAFGAFDAEDRNVMRAVVAATVRAEEDPFPRYPDVTYESIAQTVTVDAAYMALVAPE